MKYINISHFGKNLEIKFYTKGVYSAGSCCTSPEYPDIIIEKIYYKDKDIKAVVNRYDSMFPDEDVWEHIYEKIEERIDWYDL